MPTEFVVALVSAGAAVVVAGIKRGWSFGVGEKEKDFLLVVCLLAGCIYVVAVLSAGLPHRVTFANGNIRTEYGSPISPPWRWTHQAVRSFEVDPGRILLDLVIVFAGCSVFLLLFGQDPQAAHSAPAQGEANGQT